MKIPNTRRKLVLNGLLDGIDLLKVAFFDADSTIRVSKLGTPSPASKPENILILPDIEQKLRKLMLERYVLAIVSNQAGVSLGYTTLEDADITMAATLKLLKEKKVFFNYYDFADKYDENRKPKIGMALRLEDKLQKLGIQIDWANSFMVGDAAWKRGKDNRPDGKIASDHSNSDRLFAENIAKIHSGFKFYHPTDYFSWGKKYAISGIPNAKALERIKAKV